MTRHCKPGRRFRGTVMAVKALPLPFRGRRREAGKRRHALNPADAPWKKLLFLAGGLVFWLSEPGRTGRRGLRDAGRG